MVKIDFENLAKATIYSFIIIFILSFLVSKLLGIAVFPIGYGLLIVIVGVVISMVSTITLDRKIEKEEIIFFLIVVGIMLGSFFLLKNYLPDLFSSIGLNKFGGLV